MADSHINSEPLWLPVQGLYKIKPVKIPAWNGEGTLETSPPDEGQLVVTGFWSRRHFSLRMQSLVGCPLPVGHPTPMHI